MILVVMHYVPDGIEDIVRRADVIFFDFQLEVTHLSVESCWPLSSGKGHREVGEKGYTMKFQIWRETNGSDDGARTEIYERGSSDVTIHQVEVDVALAANDDAEAMVVDDEGRRLLQEEMEGFASLTKNADFVAEKNIFPDLLEMGTKNIFYVGQIQ